jgi:16S rRNA C1402 N4-methylase RsmH
MSKRSFKKRGHPDKFIFKDMTLFESNHKKMILQHLKGLMIKINDDNITVAETEATLRGMTESLTKLKEYYENRK